MNSSHLAANPRMTALVNLLLVCFVAHIGQALRLPCDSFLRPHYPEYFTYCCDYSEWSEWTYNGGRAEDSDCLTGESHDEIRYRFLMGLPRECEDFETGNVRFYCVCTNNCNYVILFDAYFFLYIIVHVQDI